MAGERGGRAAAAVCRVGVALLVGTAGLIVGGCGKQSDIHPALRVEGQDLERAKQRGRSLARSGADPYSAYATGLHDVNLRASAHVILRSAGCCWPRDEVAFEIARRGDSSEAGIRRAARDALRAAERELKFVVIVQMPKDRDPSSIEFALQTGGGQEYPPVVVEEPYYLQDAEGYHDVDAPPSGIYYYVVRFPVRGGPGIPPIGPQVRTLYLVVRDGELEASVAFSLPRPRPM